MPRSPDDRPDPVEVVRGRVREARNIARALVESDDLEDGRAIEALLDEAELELSAALRSRGLLPEPVEGEAERLREALIEAREALRLAREREVEVQQRLERSLAAVRELEAHVAALSPAPEAEEKR